MIVFAYRWAIDERLLHVMCTAMFALCGLMLLACPLIFGKLTIVHRAVRERFTVRWETGLCKLESPLEGFCLTFAQEFRRLCMSLSSGVLRHSVARSAVIGPKNRPSWKKTLPKVDIG